MNCSNGRIEVGTAPTSEIEVRDVDNALVNPTSLTVTTRDPSGDQVGYTDADPEVTNVSTGIWRFTFPAALTEYGKWHVRWDVAGGTVASHTHSFDLVPARVPV